MKGELRRPSRAARGAPLRWAGAAALLALAGFHLELLLGRIADASIGRPDVAIRWLLSAMLVAGLAELRRRRIVLRGRPAWALAFAVLLLHLGSPPAAPTPALGGLLVILPAGIALGLAIGAASPCATRGASPLRGHASLSRRSSGATLARGLGSLACRFVPRPPPRLAAAR